jgi:hypothetical protein
MIVGNNRGINPNPFQGRDEVSQKVFNPAGKGRIKFADMEYSHVSLCWCGFLRISGITIRAYLTGNQKRLATG